MQRNSSTSHGPPEVCCLFQNDPRDALQSSTRAPQLPHPLLERGDLLNFDMLDVVIKDPMTLAPEEKASLPEELISVPTHSKLTTSEPEEAAQPEDFDLVPKRSPLALPGFSRSWANESSSSLPEQADWPMSIPLGAQLDFASLESLQVTISHYPVTGKLQCEYLS